MRLRGITLLAIVVGSLLVVTGCSSSAPEARISLDNLTDTAVGLYVNGDLTGTYQPGTSVQVPLSDFGAAPYVIEVRSPSGTVLASANVNVPTAEAQANGRGNAVGDEVGLPCGIIRILVGALADGEALAPAASVEPGPCP
jgi:hypothetical protein